MSEDNWTHNERQVLEDMKKTCLIHMYLQSGSAFQNYLLNNFITLPNIILGAVTSVSLFSTSDASWRIASGVMAICSTILTGLSRQMSPGEKAQLHSSITNQYQTIIRNINMKMMLDVTSDEKQRWIDQVKNDIDRLISIQPQPSIIVIRQFEKKYHSQIENIMYPEFAGFEELIIKKAEIINKRVSTQNFKRSMSYNPNARRRNYMASSMDVMRTYVPEVAEHHQNTANSPDQRRLEDLL